MCDRRTTSRQRRRRRWALCGQYTCPWASAGTGIYRRRCAPVSNDQQECESDQHWRRSEIDQHYRRKRSIGLGCTGDRFGRRPSNDRSYFEPTLRPDICQRCFSYSDNPHRPHGGRSTTLRVSVRLTRNAHQLPMIGCRCSCRANGTECLNFEKKNRFITRRMICCKRVGCLKNY